MVPRGLVQYIAENNRNKNEVQNSYRKKENFIMKELHDLHCVIQDQTSMKYRHHEKN